PLNAKTAVLNALPSSLKNKVKGFVAAHLVKFQPAKILGFLQQFTARKNYVPVKPEADKILRIAEA
ncbi:MAG TPA: hypothetical protein VEB60_01310, partial [Candidatus Paceibacterota bacterium]|nr:hypothetical protein [Candidatus Paceibacterota bacterium]